jgi:hypothetical protein
MFLESYQVRMMSEPEKDYEFSMSDRGPAVLIQIRGRQYPSMNMGIPSMLDYADGLVERTSRFGNPGLDALVKETCKGFMERMGDLRTQRGRALNSEEIKIDFDHLSRELAAFMIVGEYGQSTEEAGPSYKTMLSKYRSKEERVGFREMIKEAAERLGYDQIFHDLMPYDPHQKELEPLVAQETKSRSALEPDAGSRRRSSQSQVLGTPEELRGVYEEVCRDEEGAEKPCPEEPDPEEVVGPVAVEQEVPDLPPPPERKARVPRRKRGLGCGVAVGVTLTILAFGVTSGVYALVPGSRKYIDKVPGVGRAIKWVAEDLPNSIADRL